MGAVAEEIRRAYLERGWRRFEAPQFRAILPEREATLALLQLVGTGKLTDRVKLLCEEGHTVWEGHARDLAEHKEDLCEYCEDPDNSTGELVKMHFTIAPDWQGALDREAAQKKTPEPSTGAHP